LQKAETFAVLPELFSQNKHGCGSGFGGAKGKKSLEMTTFTLNLIEMENYEGVNGSVADSGFLFRIPEPKFYISDPGSKRSRIRIKEFKNV
jgi:hypothetical protein